MPTEIITFFRSAVILIKCNKKVRGLWKAFCQLLTCLAHVLLVFFDAHSRVTLPGQFNWFLKFKQRFSFLFSFLDEDETDNFLEESQEQNERGKNKNDSKFI